MAVAVRVAAAAAVMLVAALHRHKVTTIFYDFKGYIEMISSTFFTQRCMFVFQRVS